MSSRRPSRSKARNLKQKKCQCDRNVEAAADDLQRQVAEGQFLRSRLLHTRIAGAPPRAAPPPRARRRRPDRLTFYFESNKN
ncbi:hypothetical protein EVAR_44365_1 [Eumeta japonica]|uniref:Uncharacterized protein n=1 Tax=Eumeta variegata TaxID=151549 RepID=A0A4C1XA34_EUMVA|nr:hypothetical protein EVAR_44365_1 [Eumeta japonica]